MRNLVKAFVVFVLFYDIAQYMVLLNYIFDIIVHTLYDMKYTLYFTM